MSFFKSLASDYDVRVPILHDDGIRLLGRIDEGIAALAGGKVPRKPISVFFPQYDTVLSATAGAVALPEPLAKPILAVGFTAEDLDCLEFIDRFFTDNYIDDPYARRRENSVVIAVTGKAGSNGEFLKIAGGKCDLELVSDGESFAVCAFTDTGRKLEQKIVSKATASLDALQKVSDALPDDDRKTILKASELMRANKVPAAFWDEISNRCIACTACNLVCPTCTCFDVIDWTAADGAVTRRRIWDSCQLDGFQRETSGHNPMGTEAKRTYRRIHHKLVADVERWEQITCMVCGRCDDACPTEIGIKSVTREIVKRFA